jgi:hypothetical protein
MIYCKLKGGLGNLLFQVAGALSIAEQNNTNVSFYNLQEQLNYLNLDNNYNPNLKHANEYSFLFENLITTPPTNFRKLDYPFNFCDKGLIDDVIIEGFFQSEKYFLNIRERLIKQFKEPLLIEKLVDEKYSQLNERVTSIHIRRGDYLKNTNYHPIQPIEYYTKAIELVKDITDYFFIFSDDIDWCKNNLIGDNFIYIDGECDYIDLFLMARCKNNIIANSSFSWWGAWLNKNENKIVIAPHLWFGPMIGENITDLIPEKWVKI